MRTLSPTPPLTAPERIGGAKAAPKGRAARRIPRADRADRVDPAPSRWAWRMQRLMLTPAFLFTLRIVLPGLLAFGATQVWLSDQERRDAVLMTVRGWQQQFETLPQFMVNDIRIDGATPGTAEDIREVLELDLPRSSFGLDLEALKASVEALPSVASASVQVGQGGTMSVGVLERLPVAVWRTSSGFDLLDASGVVTGAVASRLDRAELPLLAGEGADRAVGEALMLLATAQPLADRIRGLERMGARRWDLVLDQNMRIQLPEQRPQEALEVVLAMDEARQLLDLDVAVVDMRIAGRPTLRLNDGALGTWRQVVDLTFGR